MTSTSVARALAAVTLALALTGCTGEEEPSAEPSASESPSVDPANVSPDNLPEIPQVKGEKGAIDALTLGDCATEAGQQTVSGEISSPAKRSVDFLVTLSWTTDTGDVMGRGFAVLKDVPAGGTESFEIKAEVAEGATQCVPLVVFGTVPGG